MTTNRRRSRSLTTFLSAVLVTSLCACDPVTDLPAAEATRTAVLEPRFDPVEMPATTRPEQAVVEYPKIVGPSGDLPWYVTAVRTEPATLSEVVVWTGSGTSLGPADAPKLRGPLRLRVPGDVRSVETAADGDLAVIAGGHWVDGVYGTYLFTSVDRRAWDRVDASGLDGVNVRSVVLVDDDVVVVGVDREDDSVRALRVDADGEVSPFSIELPDGADDVAGTAARGDDVVVLATGVDAAGDRTVTAVRSRDGGSTWRQDVVEGDEATVYGVTALHDGFVATGTTRRDLPGGPGTIATAWRLSGGEHRWAVTRTDDGDEPDRSTGFSAPASYQDGYAAVLWIADTPYVQFSVETSAGAGTVARSGPYDFLGPSGPSVTGGDGVFLSVIRGSGGAEVVRVIEGFDKPFDTGTLAETARWQDSAHADEAAPDSVLVRRSYLEIDDDAWSWGPKYTDLELLDGRLVATSVERDRRFVEYAPDGRAAALSLATVGPDPRDGYHIVPAVLTESGWSESDPVEADGFAQPYDLAWVDGRWLASGKIAPGLDWSAPDRAALWDSTDGKRWLPVPGFEPGDGASEANLICATAGGAFVVGHVDGELAVWTRDEDGWRHEIVDLEPGDELMHCRPDGSGALVQVNTDAGTELRYTEDGLTYETVHVTEPDHVFGIVESVDGGFAAPGFVKTDGWEGPVLWLSPEGEDWTWTPVPTEHADVGAVYPVDDGLIVTIDATGGMEAWHVPQVAEVIASGGGSAAP